MGNKYKANNKAYNPGDPTKGKPLDTEFAKGLDEHTVEEQERAKETGSSAKGSFK
ncbi:hypothetical protein GMB86_08975 [Terrilactibacillus sp. BCM23-1]|uniref:Uncharacterized protein n=1 Tax=Terrilactibacillus tamarindi TaxID=2599694 RepID=A0A6N8CPN8_9BACI|nr:hypothetical protein [Terrilactibacillus tamarindi]MTT32139.1 hypothetical protein [Terrilactibacillus tamarindi]